MTLILSVSIGRQIKLTNRLIDESGQEAPRYDDTRLALRSCLASGLRNKNLTS